MTDKEREQELNPEEMEQVAGGFQIHGASTADILSRTESSADGGRTVTAFCNTCNKKTSFRVFSGARGTCSVCGTMQTI